MNSFKLKQNTETSLRRLAAQSFLYSFAKKIFAIQVILSVPIIVILSFLTLSFPQVKIISATWAILLTLFDLLFLKNYIKTLKRKAANIQELFDCDVLGIEWQEIKIEIIPSVDEIFEYSNEYKRKEGNYDKLVNWYPLQIDELPSIGIQIICQYLNCWWDLKLRKKYTNSLIIILVVFFLIILVLGLINGITLADFILLFILPIMPAMILGIRQINDNKEFIHKAEKVKRIAHSLWVTILSNKFSEKKLHQKIRRLQDEIYDRRCQNPLIFDFIYWRLRSTQEREMVEIAKELILEYKHSTTNVVL